MKKLSFTGLLLLTYFIGVSQTNMVPNGDFEYYSPCPNSLSQTANCNGWTPWTGGTSDYFNVCATTGGVLVPNNTFGFQQAASGNGYVGGYQNATPTNNPYKEYVTRAIIPLQVGATYEVSISVSLANNWGAVAVDDIGIYFFIGAPTSIPVSTRVAVTPQITFPGNGVYADTMNWIRLVEKFVADSAYTNIVIGSFRDPSLVTTQQVGTGNTSYYFFDSVVVRTYDSVYFALTDTLLCAGDSFDLKYNVSSTGIFNSGNVFSAQLSDASGNFANDSTDIIGTDTSTTTGTIKCKIPLNITPGTQYRVRIIASKPKHISKASVKEMTIGVYPQNFDAKVGKPVCVGDPINLDASSSTSVGNMRYNWTGPDGFKDSVKSPVIPSAEYAHEGSYVVTASVYHCSSTDSVEFTVSAYPVVSVSNNSPICVDSTLVLTAIADTSSVVFAWTGPNNFASNIGIVSIPFSTKENTGTYNLTASNNGCEVKRSIYADVISIKFDLGEDVHLCNGEVITLGTDTAIDGSYLWNNRSTDTMLTVTTGGTYQLAVSNPVCGVVSDLLNVFYEKCECEPFVPNAFTPNNDGLNDKVGPRLDCRVTGEYNFIIVNRFGEVVFKSEMPGEKWDGVYKGERAEIGTYFYLLQMTGPRDAKWQFKGDIILIR